MGIMPSAAGRPAIRWYRSFYFRIGFSFVMFVVSLLVIQSLLFSFARDRSPLRGRSPNAIVAIVAADVAALLDQDVAADVDAHLKREYVRNPPIYVVMRSGAVFSNQSVPLADDIRRYVAGLLAGGLGQAGVEPRVSTPFVTAPVQVKDVLSGIVVFPPRPEPGPLTREFERITSLPGTALLVVLTMIAAAFLFEPARRRLDALQAAATRLGSGDLTARADVRGGDEVAAVAVAFNTMAAELARRDDALRSSDRLRRQMLADVSHELKTPLTAMRGYVETLRSDAVALDRETRDRYFATLERETMRLDRIVRDLLDLSRLENGVTGLERRVFATGRVFEHVVSRHQPEIERRGIDVRVDVSAAADQIVADPDRIEQVVENLFANALRHTPDGGSVNLSAWMDGAAAMIEVRDSGAGIPAEHLPHVFERFYKADSARANASGGSGLGLSIAKAIVERHNGRIAVASQPGHTTFTIALPQDDD
jgi:signal transduction histidine kinase